MARDREPEDLQRITVESLKLVVQSQMILADLQNNQKRLEDLISRLVEKEGEVDD